MRGNLYAVNTVAVVVDKENFTVGPGSEETIEFRHLVESASLANACTIAHVKEYDRCKDMYSEVKKASVVSGELLVNVEEVVVDEMLDGVVGSISPSNDD